MTAMRNYNVQIAEYLASDPHTSPDGVDLTSATPLLGALTGTAPGPGEQDSRSYSGLAKGGIYTRPPKPWDPNDNRGATPVAFSSTSGLIKPCVAVMQESSIRHPQSERIAKAIIASVACWIYIPVIDSGKTAAAEIRFRLNLLIDGLVWTTDQGPVAQVQWDFELGERENPREYAGSRVDMIRYFVTTLRGVEV